MLTLLKKDSSLGVKIPHPTFILRSNVRAILSKMFLNIILLFIYSLSGVSSSVIGTYNY